MSRLIFPPNLGISSFVTDARGGNVWSDTNPTWNYWEELEPNSNRTEPILTWSWH